MQFDNVSRAQLAAILVCLTLLLAQGCSDAGSPAAGSPSVAAPEQAQRFTVQLLPMRRGPGLLLRLDTATGQAWTMGSMDAAVWIPLREAAEGVPSAGATEAGRYEIWTIAQTRGAPTLVRIDGATGVIWRKGLKSQGPWVAVPNPDPSVLSPPENRAPISDADADADAPAGGGDES